MITAFFHTILTQPLFNILVFLYNTVAFGDFGLAVIFITVLIRLILWPLSYKAIRAQRDIQVIQPKVKEIQNKYKNNKEEQTKALLELYKENKVNPLGGCLPVLVQLPILIGLYSVLLKGLNPEYLQNLYSFIDNPEIINPSFLGILDLSSKSAVLALITGVLQFFQSKMIMPGVGLRDKVKKGPEAIGQMVTKQTVYFLPVVTIFIAWSLPAGLPLYWSTTTLFTIFQQFIIMRTQNGKERGNKKNSRGDDGLIRSQGKD